MRTLAVRIRAIGWLWLYFVGFPFISFGQDVGLATIQVTDETNTLLGQQVSYYIDTTGQLTPTEAWGKPYTAETKATPNFATKPYPVYLRFSVTNDSKDTPILEAQNPMLENITLYQIMDGTPKLIFDGGVDQPFPNRPFQSPWWAMPLPLETGESGTFLLRVQTGFAFHLPLRMHSTPEYVDAHQKISIFWGTYLGVMVFALIYNLFVFFSVRDRSYGYYLIYLVFISTFYLTLEGLGFQYVWPNIPQLNYQLHFFDALVAISVILFTMNFLQLKQKAKRGYYFAVFMLVYFGVVLFVNTFVDFSLAGVMGQLGSVILALYVIGVGVYALFKGIYVARFFVAAWTLFMSTAIIYFGALNGLFPYTFLTSNALYMGNMSEVILLSLALADRINLLKRENRKKQEALIAQERENQQAKLTALRAQLNPHFIYNSLASIQNYILNHDRKDANDFLTRFSRLIRNILDQSDKPITTVAEEFEALRDYLEIEKLRMGDNFDYELFIHPDLDAHEAYMPSMLIQIFAENALWHGLSPKEGHRQLRILAEPANDGLIIIVEDNGIGREAAYQQKTGSPYQSKGTKMVDYKIDLFNQQRAQPVTLSTLDLTDAQGQPEGTRVEMMIPASA
ncbi:MAG TPA: hypothetical protein DCR93_01125 [Cytophagales bacterium]|nr:hypothetical protein [Cytophagales bacterium]